MELLRQVLACKHPSPLRPAWGLGACEAMRCQCPGDSRESGALESDLYMESPEDALPTNGSELGLEGSTADA